MQKEKIYRQLANYKTKNMKQTDFSATAIIQKDGKIANLIYPNNYPWTVCQAIEIGDQEELDRYRLYFSDKYLPMYFAKNGDKSFFVVQTSGCTSGKKLDINQANHAQVYKDIQNCLQAAADWWSEYKDSGQQVALSL